MSEQPPAVVPPRPGVAYPITLGASLGGAGGSGSGGGGGGDEFTSFKYDWKVGGGDATKMGRVKRARDGNKVSVQFQNVVEGERAIRYQVRRDERGATTHPPTITPLPTHTAHPRRTLHLVLGFGFFLSVLLRVFFRHLGFMPSPRVPVPVQTPPWLTCYYCLAPCSQGVYMSKKDDGSGGVECALIFDGEMGFRLERLGGTVKSLKITRGDEDDEGTGEAGIGEGVGEDFETRAANRAAAAAAAAATAAAAAAKAAGAAAAAAGAGAGAGAGAAAAGGAAGAGAAGAGAGAVRRKPPQQDQREHDVMEAAAAAVGGEDWAGGGGREAKKPRAEPEPMHIDDDAGGGAGGEGGGGEGRAPSPFAQFVSESDSSSSDDDSDSEEDILAPLAENA
jgi:hypothetical protein